MQLRTWRLLGLACLLALVSASAYSADQPNYSNKWRIEVSESAKSAGTMLFRLTPKDGAPIEVSVAIADGRSENHIAKDIRDALKTALDAKAFHTEVDDGEDVLVKKKKGPDFALVLVESNVEAVRIHGEKE
ncbi:MAG: hypothetical protein K0R70_41 [Steroidobacteraceae bacterium]|nr:hypothetical protein [Steroidobacteraceae bacterium]